VLRDYYFEVHGHVSLNRIRCVAGEEKFENAVTEKHRTYCTALHCTVTPADCLKSVFLGKVEVIPGLN
jgi:hypothetical protein